MNELATRERRTPAHAWEWDWRDIPLEWAMCAFGLLGAAGLKLFGVWP